MHTVWMTAMSVRAVLLLAGPLWAWPIGAPAGGAAAQAPLTAQAQAPAYAQVRPSADGIGKAYMGREIARVMGWQGADWLERGERTVEERPDLLHAALALQPGMVVADVGAGTGYHAVRMAADVRAKGTVYAVDVQPEMIALLKQRMAREGVRNIVSVLGSPTDTRLPEGVLDLALFVDVYHELDAPFELMASVVRALKPGGRVVLVEYRAEDPDVPIKALHKMSEAQVRREMAVHPLQWERTVGTLPWQHVVIFRKP
jgi:precorrin-6B methylase 2